MKLQDRIRLAILARLEAKSDHHYHWPRWAAAEEAAIAVMELLDSEPKGDCEFEAVYTGGTKPVHQYNNCTTHNQIASLNAIQCKVARTNQISGQDSDEPNFGSEFPVEEFRVHISDWPYCLSLPWHQHADGTWHGKPQEPVLEPSNNEVDLDPDLILEAVREAYTALDKIYELLERKMN